MVKMIEKIVEETKAYYCLDCGKCTSSCPVAMLNPRFSPRLLVEQALIGFENLVVRDAELWSCLTCGACSNYCPSMVDFQKFVRKVREESLKKGLTGIKSHGGIFNSITKFLCRENIKQDRLGWLTPELRVRQKGETLYFVGCQPYFDIIFEEIKVNCLDNIAKLVVKLLNKAGIEPVVLANERCCGHDALWSGDVETFEKLLELNLREIKGRGVKRVVTNCPECLRTLKIDYAEYAKIDFEVLHITEMLLELANKDKISFSKVDGKVTYHDPCRLGKHLGIYEAPRSLLGMIPGVEFVEMENNRGNSLCCGTSLWSNCDMFSESIRVSRLREAQATGAGTLLTACPKCQIHFKCSLSCDSGRNLDVSLGVEDLVTYVAKAAGVV